MTFNKSILRVLFLSGLVFFFSQPYESFGKNESQVSGLSASQSLTELKEGNQRFIESKALTPRQDLARIQETAQGQYPKALVLTCSDSRVPVETIFDQGIGDIFVIRIPGNTATMPVIAAIEYALEHLNVPLAIVLGHTECGAIKLACSGEPLVGHQAYMANPIEPVVDIVKATGITEPEALYSPVTLGNVENTMTTIFEAFPALQENFLSKKIILIGGIYNVHQGSISWTEAFNMK